MTPSTLAVVSGPTPRLPREMYMQIQVLEGVPMRTRPSKSATYLLRIEPDEKARLEKLAERAGISLAEAMREGASTLLRERTLHAVPTQLPLTDGQGGNQVATAT